MEYVMNYLSFVRLKDISTLEFKPQDSTSGLSTSDFSNINFSTPDFSTNPMVQKFVVEKSRIDMSSL